MPLAAVLAHRQMSRRKPKGCLITSHPCSPSPQSVTSFLYFNIHILEGACFIVPEKARVCVCVCVCVIVPEKARVCVCVRCSVVSDSVTQWTVACQAPLSMEFSRWEYWSGLPFRTLAYLPTQGLNWHLLHWQADSLPLSYQGSPIGLIIGNYN